ncbi:MAG: 50S ribosomal protein L6 [Actinobacteria bacterium ADurb.Bin346]|nr:MAG: 50S ribosomal protein L6 [Actinobacteria bacterium ADurb.Bin346]
MSRVGKRPISIPSGVEININDNNVTVKGKLGEMSQAVDKNIRLEIKDNEMLLSPIIDNAKAGAKHGLYRNLLSNMVTGVSSGFEKTLKIVGVGYRASKKGEDLEILVGYSNPVIFKKPEDISFDLPDNTTIVVKGIDKQRVGQVASQIRDLRKPEPYKGKGIRYANEVVRKKAGKAASSSKGGK